MSPTNYRLAAFASPEAVEVEPDLELLRPLRQPVQEPLLAGSVFKKPIALLAPVAHHPAGDVVNGAWKLHPQRSSHARHYEPALSPCKALTLILRADPRACRTPEPVDADGARFCEIQTLPKIAWFGKVWLNLI